MPKPLKKSTRKPRKRTTPKRPSSDPNLRAHQMMAEMAAKQAQGPSGKTWWDKDGPKSVTHEPGPPVDFEAAYRVRMAELGRKGGKIGGKRRLQTMTPAKRSEMARKAAAARWKGK